MSDSDIRQVLAGQKALVIGVANDQSIAYGCAKAFHMVGAELAITWLNERARRYVEPLAQPSRVVPQPLEILLGIPVRRIARDKHRADIGRDRDGENDEDSKGFRHGGNGLTDAATLASASCGAIRNQARTAVIPRGFAFAETS